ncbi:hypothetical protein [Dyella nitratireducens]|uniref:hypothetical protein n=1 Tax=Dyella nitratireducens TaxID=1849580 RepID=UPI00166CD234|nr:hypothetical protein [Dyella nitratireducens]
MSRRRNNDAGAALLHMHINAISKRIVIPAKAGIHGKYEAWIPAFAGMTIR